MAATQDRILEYLRGHPETTAPELARALHLTVQNIRHHLHRLLDEGWVETGRKATANRQGRPAHFYHLDTGRQPNNLAGLASALLVELFRDRSPQDSEQILRAVAARLVPGPLKTDMHLTQRLNFVVRQLNGLHYDARWEARAAGPRITLRRSPYGALIGAHPELHLIDQYLLEYLLAQPVTLISHGPPGKDGGNSYRTYQISGSGLRLSS